MLKKLKVLYTIPNFDTCGSGIALLKLVNNLNKDIFEPIIICNHGEGEGFRLVLESGVKYYFYDYLAPIRPIFKFLAGIIKTFIFFKKLNPDIIFSYHYGANFSEAIVAKMCGAKFVYVKKNMSWFGPSFRQWRIKTVLSDAIVIQNRQMLHDFFNESPKARLISIGVDLTEYYPKIPNQQLIEELSIDKESKVILCVANIIPKKGIDYLLNGFSQFINKINKQKPTLLIVGENSSEYGQSMVELMYSLNLSEHVKFTGKRFDVNQFYSIADLFILPSTGNEGAPIVIQEAMASGVLVITTKTPGNKEQLEFSQNQLFEPMNPYAICDALVQFLSLDRGEVEDLVNEQLKFVSLNYSLESEVKKHSKMYKEILSKNNQC
jgi:glycosyltransferase involved in cell wall biosynthesis